MNDKTKVWSDGRDRAPDVEDMMSSLGDEQDLQVTESVSSRGAILTSNCKHCGRQGKSVWPWGEIAMMFLGQETNPPQWKLRIDGVVVSLGCGCGKTTPMLVGVDEIAKWIKLGIRVGALAPEILNARRR